MALWSQWVVLLQRLYNDRYVPVLRPMMLDRSHRNASQSHRTDQIVDVEDEFGHGRTVEIISAPVLKSTYNVSCLNHMFFQL